MSSEREKQRKILGAALKARRERLGLRQSDVASRVGCNRSHYTAVEQGRTCMAPEKAIKLARALEVDERRVAKRMMIARAPEFHELLWPKLKLSDSII